MIDLVPKMFSFRPNAHLFKKRCYNASVIKRTSRICASHVESFETEDTTKLLDSYWKARGIFDPYQRQQLVELAMKMDNEDEDNVSVDTLPGISRTWQGRSSPAEVVEVSRRLLQLHTLMGGGSDIDVVWMVVREPGLMTCSLTDVTRRLFDMKILTQGMAVDVVKIVERQPGLLLSDSWTLGGLPMAGSGSGSANMEDGQQLVQAWAHGLSSDGDFEWSRRCEQLRLYKLTHGDTSVGFRDGDDNDLSRWAAKQRSDARWDELDPEKRSTLETLGFDFDADMAEWRRWWKELAEIKQAEGHANPTPLTAGANLYLVNWCSVQRVARRTGVLSQKRIDMLDSVGFDWSGADPLS